jgi:hypothetical protein
MARWGVFPDGDEPARAVTALAEQVERDGGRALAIYRDPVGEHWQIFCLLPLDKVEPTPYQRDLSPTHTKRLQEVVKKIDRFVDPIVVSRPSRASTDAERQPSARGARQGRDDPRHPRPQPESRSDPRAQHGESLPQEKASIRMYRGLAREERSGETTTVSVRVAHFMHSASSMAMPLAGRAFAPILPRRQVRRATSRRR